MIKSIVLVADTYYPSRNSAAVQLRDLAIEFYRQGVDVTIISTDSGLHDGNLITVSDNINVLHLKTLRHKNMGRVRRAVAEILLPIFLIRNLRKSQLKGSKWDAIVWYSPSIFLGPFVYYLTKKNACKAYLILRDIFPTWALDLGLIKKGLTYYLFRFFERMQYSIADCIGVQAVGNLDYFKSSLGLEHKKIEVLHNWLSPKPLSHCSVDVSTLPIRNRKIFVYAGNMGIAQGMGDLLHLAEALLWNDEIGFLFIGRGSDMELLRNDAKKRGLINTVFCDEIDTEEIPGLFAQCHVGLIALDARHKTHNIPGKFLSYIQSELPVVAIINEGNDLELIIKKYQVGRVTTDRSNENLQLIVESLLYEISFNKKIIASRCNNLSAELFSTKRAVDQILMALNSLK